MTPVKFLLLLFIFQCTHLWAQESTLGNKEQVKKELLKKFQDTQSAFNEGKLSRDEFLKQIKEADEFRKKAGVELSEVLPIIKSAQVLENGSQNANTAFVIEKMANPSLSQRELEFLKSTNSSFAADIYGRVMYDLLQAIKDPKNLDQGPVASFFYKKIGQEYFSKFYDIAIVEIEKGKKLRAGYYPDSVKQKVVDEVEVIMEVRIKKKKDVDFLIKMVTDANFRERTVLQIIEKYTNEYDNLVLEKAKKRNKKEVDSSQEIEVVSFWGKIFKNKGVILALIVLAVVVIFDVRRKK